MKPIPRPAHLDIASPKSALLSYHSERASRLRAILTEFMMAALDEPLRMGFETPEEARAAGYEVTPEEWWARIETLKWEDGSPTAVIRDEMRFHERCMEYLVNG